MTFDGRQYLGASPVNPQSVSAGAPAIGDALLQSQIAGFFASRHRSKMVGNQTYPWRVAQDAPIDAITSATGVDVAEWPDVYLPAHVTHVGVQVYFEHQRLAGESVAYHTVVISDGTSTDTGTEFATTITDAEPASESPSGLALYSAYAFVAVATVTNPGPVSVRLMGHLRDSGGSFNWAYTPRAVTAWRWTV